MQSQSLVIQQRTAKLTAAIEAVAGEVDSADRAQTILAALRKATKEMDAGYRHACASASPTDFISRISAVARHAKKTKASLMLLTQLDYVPITKTRDLILQARGLENIFVTSRNTAKRRYRARLGSRRNSHERAELASARKATQRS
jgi:hypothetical protein